MGVIDLYKRGLSLEGRTGLASLLLRATEQTVALGEATIPKSHQLGRSSLSLKVFNKARPLKVLGPPVKTVNGQNNDVSAIPVGSCILLAQIPLVCLNHCKTHL